MKNIGAPKRSNWTRWIDPRGKSTGSIGFIVNRLAGLGLTLYLFMHLIVLGKLAQGKESFDGFTALAHNPIIVAGEVIVIFAVMLHGFNGLRIALTSIGYNVGNQKDAVSYICNCHRYWPVLCISDVWRCGMMSKTSNLRKWMIMVYQTDQRGTCFSVDHGSYCC